jgi:uncharacterized membrane protein
MIYLSLKFLHIVGAILFLGNISTAAFWKAHADKTRDPKIITHALEGVMRADRAFTMPGVMIILVAGFAAALVARLPLFRTAWVSGGIALFVITAIIFMTRVGPLQRRMLALARASADGQNFDWPTYEKLSRSWAIWGSIAVLIPLLAAGLMVFKPT